MTQPGAEPLPVQARAVHERAPLHGAPVEAPAAPLYAATATRAPVAAYTTVVLAILLVFVFVAVAVVRVVVAVA